MYLGRIKAESSVRPNGEILGKLMKQRANAIKFMSTPTRTSRLRRIRCKWNQWKKRLTARGEYIFEWGMEALSCIDIFVQSYRREAKANLARRCTIWKGWVSFIKMLIRKFLDFKYFKKIEKSENVSNFVVWTLRGKGNFSPNIL